MNASSSRPLRLLVSDFALKTWGARIEAAFPAGDLSFVTAEEALAAGSPSDIDIAFMTTFGRAVLLGQAFAVTKLDGPGPVA